MTASRLATTASSISSMVAAVHCSATSFVRDLVCFQIQDRNRIEFAARLQNIWGNHTVKYGFEYGNAISTRSTPISSGAPTIFPDPLDFSRMQRRQQ